jgi:hypothetical protein
MQTMEADAPCRAALGLIINPMLVSLRRMDPASHCAGGSTQPGGANSTENRFQLSLMPNGAMPLVP